jgi:putative ABC transport system permease protein
VITFTNSYGSSTDLTVTGVLEDLPHNAHLHFDFLAPITSMSGNMEDWNTFLSTYTYLLLPEGYDPAGLAAKLPAFVDRYVGPELGADEVFNLSVQPLTDIRLHSHLYAEAEPNGNIAYIYLFTAIAVFILAIGCINFMNLATARSSQRAREVGLRKTVGARRGQLVQQFLGESLVLSLGAGLLALLLTALLIPFYADLAGKPWTFADALAPGFLLCLGAITVVVGLLAGSYPAFVLSSFRPSEVLKGQARRSGIRLRRGLVVFQFVVSVALLVCTAVVHQQMQYVRGKDLGFAPEQVVAVPISTALGEQADAVKQALASHPGILGTTVSLLVPGEDVWTYGTRRAGADQGFAVGTYTVDYDFLGVYGLDLEAGRNFSPAMPSDSAAFVLNEAAVRAFGWESAEAALGERITWSGRVEGEVIGVVSDFHAESLHEQIEPLLFVLYPDYYYLSARVAADQAGPALAFIEETLAAFAPDRPFESFFIDQRFDALYRSDQQIGRLFGVFALLAILVACLGLFGLSAFSAEQRTKEIGIRKVMGASAAGIALLLSREVTRLLLLAVVIAVPIAYFSMDRWLSGFAYRVDLGAGVFVLAALAALLVAWLTVGYQSVRAALADPVKALRYE